VLLVILSQIDERLMIFLTGQDRPRDVLACSICGAEDQQIANDTDADQLSFHFCSGRCDGWGLPERQIFIGVEADSIGGGNIRGLVSPIFAEFLAWHDGRGAGERFSKTHCDCNSPSHWLTSPLEQLLTTTPEGCSTG